MKRKPSDIGAHDAAMRVLARFYESLAGDDAVNYHLGEVGYAPLNHAGCEDVRSVLRAVVFGNPQPRKRRERSK